MAGKHRQPSRRRSPKRWLPGLTAAAVSATGLSTAVMTGTTTTMTVPAVKLAATVLPANSTAQIFAGSTYYGQDYAKTDPPTQVVPFFLGPRGIAAAIDQHQNDANKVVVLSSGWGAGQTSTALALMQNDPARQNIKLVILDNNTNRAGGGFWTTYWMFAPLLLTSSQPTPSNTDVPVVDTAYEYNINSDAPTYPINVIADLNSLVAYGYDYGAQSTAPMPADALAAQPSDPQHYHYVVDTNGTVVRKDPVPGTITYVTFESDGLPLVRPLRLLPGGDIVANALQPALTDLVDWGYHDNKPIPDDPGITQPVGLLPPIGQTTATLGSLPTAIQTGAQDGAASAAADIASPTNFVTKPVAEAKATAGIVTGILPISSLPSSSANVANASTLASGSSKTVAPASMPTSAVKTLAGNVSSALGGVAGSLTKGVQKAAGADLSGSHSTSK
jgi:hypothetical protein